MHRRSNHAVGLLTAILLAAGGAARADIDASGTWRVQLFTDVGNADNTEHWTQVGTMLTTTTGGMSSGTIDPVTGEFSETFYLTFCGPSSRSGTVAADGRTFTASGALIVGSSPTLCTFPIGAFYLGTRCGTGAIEAGEPCDDGNLDDGDGCSSECEIEQCYECSGVPSVCAAGPSGAPCDDGDACTTSECDAAGACLATGAEPVGTSCDDANECTSTACDGAGECAVTATAPQGAPCDDGSECTINACNDSGTCVVTVPFPQACPDDGNDCTLSACGSGRCFQAISSGGYCNGGNACITGICEEGVCEQTGVVTCDDGSACTADSCDPDDGCQYVPDVRICRSAAESTLRLDSANTDDDKLVWKWRRGAATDLSDFADPIAGADYSFCLFAGGEVAGEANIAPGDSWSPTRRGGFKYSDPAGAADGVQRVILKSGGAAAAKIMLTGRGMSLDMAAPPLAEPVTAQLGNQATGVCWSSTFDAADVLRNEEGRFKARSTAP